MWRIGALVACVVTAGCLGVPAYVGPGDASGDDSGAGYDEDSDGLADGVDPCPHIDRAQTDLDGDGIGDDCDPSPTDMATKDTSLFFGFRNQVTGDLLKEGAFVVNDGFILLGTAGDSSDNYLKIGDTFLETQIEIGFEVVAASASGAGVVAVQMSEPPGQPRDGGNCAILSGNASEIFVTAGWGENSREPTGTGPPSFGVVEGHLRGRYKSAVVDCVADELAPNGGPFHATWNQGPVAVLGPPSVHAISAQVRILYIFVAGRP